jgi:hypothetical protein
MGLREIESPIVPPKIAGIAERNQKARVSEHVGLWCVPFQKWPIFPISALRKKFNPRNIIYMPAVKFFARLDLDQICLFPDGHTFMPFQKWPVFPISAPGKDITFLDGTGWIEYLRCSLSPLAQTMTASLQRDRSNLGYRLTSAPAVTSSNAS